MLNIISYRQAVADAFPEIEFGEGWARGCFFSKILCYILHSLINHLTLPWQTLIPKVIGRIERTDVSF
jgi:hypothetical protein